MGRDVARIPITLTIAPDRTQHALTYFTVPAKPDDVWSVRSAPQMDEENVLLFTQVLCHLKRLNVRVKIH